MSFIIKRTIRSTVPYTYHYYNGKGKGIWTTDKIKAKEFHTKLMGMVTIEGIRLNTFETNPLTVININ